MADLTVYPVNRGIPSPQILKIRVATRSRACRSKIRSAGRPSFCHESVHKIWPKSTELDGATRNCSAGRPKSRAQNRFGFYLV